MDFAAHIRELLMIHDCVILPGLGGFVANYRPAVINPSQQTIHPPSRQILFNPELVYNDGLLYAHASKKSGYGYKEVGEFAETFVRQIIRDIDKGLKHTLEDIGYFYRDSEKKIRFAADPGSNFLIDAYGLPFLRYKEFDTAVAGRRRTYRSLPADPLAGRSRIKRIAITAAAACLVTALVLVPIKTGYFSEAGMDIPPGDSYGVSGSQTKIVEKPEETTAVLQTAELSHDIIVGSFREFGNARMMRNSLVQKGYGARILAAESDYYRVSVGRYLQPGEARQALSEIRAEGYASAWILTD